MQLRPAVLFRDLRPISFFFFFLKRPISWTLKMGKKSGYVPLFYQLLPWQILHFPQLTFRRAWKYIESRFSFFVQVAWFSRTEFTFQFLEINNLPRCPFFMVLELARFWKKIKLLNIRRRLNVQKVYLIWNGSFNCYCSNHDYKTHIFKPFLFID